MPLSAPLAPPRIPSAYRADCEFCPEPRRHRRWVHRHCIERELRGSQRSLSL